MMLYVQYMRYMLLGKALSIKLVMARIEEDRATKPTPKIFTSLFVNIAATHEL